MGSKGEENKKCGIEDIVLPEEVRLTYFPRTETKFAYDVLPLFEQTEYKKKLAREVSILNNQKIAEKWEEFRNGMPKTLLELKPVGLDESKVAIFANYRRQKVSPEVLAAYIGPSSPDAIFRRSK